MYARPTNLRFGIAFALGVVGTLTLQASAQEVLHLYGPLGLNPAIKEAADIFAARHGVGVEVASGALSEWREDVKKNGDLVYCTGEFIMSDFVRNKEAPVYERSLARLYVRPSFMLVRPDNPKDIRDFPDLLRPGMKVMLVNGSGLSGLWENMTGRLQSLQNLVALQKNIVVCAADTEEAMRTWRERKDIDAWLTWNVWHMPRRDSAKVIPISDDYKIYRECSVSLTERSRNNPIAAEFVDFLASRECADIFGSWGWAHTPADVSPAIADKGVCVACRIRNDVWTHSVGRGLERVQRLVEEYRSLGIPYSDIHICAVFDGDAAYWMLKDQPYEAFTSKAEENPNKVLIDRLVASGISVEISAQTMAEHGWSKGDLLPGIRVVSGANARIADLGSKGYAYLPF